MKTHPVLTPGGQSIAFEVENAYIGSSTIASLLEGVKEVTELQRRKIFAGSNDVHMEFKYLGLPYIVWEPFGDSSRYWIGPKNQTGDVADISALETVFKHYQPSLPRAILGDLISLRFINRFMRGGQ